MCTRMRTNTDNLESSLPTSNLLKSVVQVEFCYKLHMSSWRSSRVPASMECVVQVTSVGNI